MTWAWTTTQATYILLGAHDLCTKKPVGGENEGCGGAVGCRREDRAQLQVETPDAVLRGEPDPPGLENKWSGTTELSKYAGFLCESSGIICMIVMAGEL